MYDRWILQSSFIYFFILDEKFEKRKKKEGRLSGTIEWKNK